MSNRSTIAGIDIGSSKISVVVCEYRGGNKMVMRGKGTAIVKGVVGGIIQHPEQFEISLQDAISRASADSNCRISDVVVNIPTGNSDFSIQSGIVRFETIGAMTQKAATEQAMKKAAECVERKNRSLMHLFPLRQMLDNTSGITHSPGTLTVDAGIIMGDAQNLAYVGSAIKKMRCTVRGVIHDYLAMTAIYPEPIEAPHVIIDMGSQTTSWCICANRLVQWAHTEPMGSDHITSDLAKALSCALSEAERVKVLHGTLATVDGAATIDIHGPEGVRRVSAQIVQQVIRKRVSQIVDAIVHQAAHDTPIERVILVGSGSHLVGLSDWVSTQFAVPVRTCIQHPVLDVSSHYQLALAMLIYAAKIGLIAKTPRGIWEWFSRHLRKNGIEF
jgi:cell division protein FtsA